jgi:hypothetical protein
LKLLLGASWAIEDLTMKQLYLLGSFPSHVTVFCIVSFPWSSFFIQYVKNKIIRLSTCALKRPSKWNINYATFNSYLVFLNLDLVTTPIYFCFNHINDISFLWYCDVLLAFRIYFPVPNMDNLVILRYMCVVLSILLSLFLNCHTVVF